MNSSKFIWRSTSPNAAKRPIREAMVAYPRWAEMQQRVEAKMVISLRTMSGAGE